MGDSSRSSLAITAGFLLKRVTQRLEAFRRAQSDMAQTTTWLVGLASSMLAIALAQRQSLSAALGGDAARLHDLAFALQSTIAAGLISRMLSVLGSQYLEGAGLDATGAISSKVASVEFEPMKDLDPAWTKEQILAALDREPLFNSAAVPAGAGLEECQTIYRLYFSAIAQREARALLEIEEVVGALAGSGKQAGAAGQSRVSRLLRSTSTATSVRRRVWAYFVLEAGAIILFCTTCWSFLYAVWNVAAFVGR